MLKLVDALGAVLTSKDCVFGNKSQVLKRFRSDNSVNFMKHLQTRCMNDGEPEKMKNRVLMAHRVDAGTNWPGHTA